MLVRTFGPLPCYAPETGAGAGADTGAEPGGAAPPPADTGGEVEGAEPEPQEQQPEGPGSGRSKLRKQLEGAANKARKAQPEPKKGQQQSRARQEGLAPDPEAGEQEGQEPKPQEQQQIAAPEGWPKEAKAEWAKVPPAVQAAVAKRETDMAAGVEQLKKGYAELDGAIQPYLGAIQHHKITPAAAVKQLFGWMDALTREAAGLKAGKAPEGVFAALAQSYGIDPVKLLAHMVQNPQAQQQQQGAPQGQPNGQLDPAVKAYIDSIIAPVGQGINQLATTVQQQSMQKTEEMLGMWSKDKPFYGEVRGLMAKFLSPGPNGEPAVVPPLPNGNADLDKAYDMAVYADPAVRAKAQKAMVDAEAATKAAAAQAEKDAQRTKLEAARKASGSIPISAPGAPNGAAPKNQKRGKSVRESLEDAQREVAERAGRV
jgi:hypothetical protein